MGNPSVTEITLTLKDQGGGVLGTKTPVVSSEYAIGVPHPQDSFGYDPLTIAQPSDPAEWPGAEKAGFYFIDPDDVSSTDTANTYGYPDLPRKTIPEKTYDASDRMLQVFGTHGSFSGGNQLNIVITGSAEEPFFFVGELASEAIITGRIDLTNSTHLIFDNLIFDSTGESTYGIQLRFNNTFITMRNIEGFDDGTVKGAASLFNVGAEAANVTLRNSNIVAFNMNIHDFGNNDGLQEDDAKAFATNQGYDFFWCIGNTMTRLGGDAINPGANSASQVSPFLTNRPTHTYIARNTISANGENAIDVKSSDKTVISQNELFDFTAGTSSSGECIVAHESCTDVFIIANEIYDSGIGINCTDGSEVTAMSNVIRDITNARSSSTPEGGYAFNTRGSTAIFSNNTVVGCGGGFRVESSQVVEILSNTFTGRTANVESAGSHDINFEISDLTGKTEDFNHFDNFNIQVSSTNYTVVATYETATSLGGNEQEGAPLFVNAAADDYQPDTGSPLISNGNDSSGYADFLSLFSIDIEIDFNEVDRPAIATDWAIGSQEPA